MKFILTGCTGFIGSEVLSQCLLNPFITSVTVLSRRQLPNPPNPKLRVILMTDFTSYPDSIISELEGADACIWCMGTTAGNRALEVDYPLAFGYAISKTLQRHKKPFRYIHLSGSTTERDQTKPLWFKSEMRKNKGQAEVNMLEFARNEEFWKTVIVKSGFVVSKEGNSMRDMVGYVAGTKKSIRVDELAVGMIDVAINGSEDETLEDNEAMVKRGRRVLNGILITK